MELASCAFEAGNVGGAQGASRSQVGTADRIDENVFSGALMAKFSIQHCLPVFDEFVFPS